MATHVTYKRTADGKAQTLERKRRRAEKRGHAVDLHRVAREIGATVR